MELSIYSTVYLNMLAAQKALILCMFVFNYFLKRQLVSVLLCSAAVLLSPVLYKHHTTSISGSEHLHWMQITAAEQAGGHFSK